MNIEAQVEMIVAKKNIANFVKDALNNGFNEAEILAVLEGLLKDQPEGIPLMKLWAQEAIKELKK